jgi:hypothetical protein
MKRRFQVIEYFTLQNFARFVEVQWNRIRLRDRISEFESRQSVGFFRGQSTTMLLSKNGPDTHCSCVPTLAVNYIIKTSYHYLI